MVICIIQHYYITGKFGNYLYFFYICHQMNSNSDIQRIKVIKNRTEKYKKFTLLLLDIISEYYLDKNTLNNDIDIQNHFNWCFLKACDKFSEEGYKFHYNDSLKGYFYSYYYQNIYKSIKFDTKENITKNLFEEFWKKIFDISTTKDKHIIAILAEIYKLFDKTINNNIIINETEDKLVLEKEKINLLSKNIDITKFNKIYEFKYANNTIAIAELKSEKLIFIDEYGDENVLNFSDDDIASMDSYIRGIYINQLINERIFYTVSQFIYSDNSLAKAETIKGKSVFINKLGEIVKFHLKN